MAVNDDTDATAGSGEPLVDADSGFSDAEREAMRQRAAELRAQGRGGARRVDDLRAVLDAIAAMPEQDRVLAERVHAIVTRVAPHLHVKTWYGFPAYADGKQVVCFFKSAAKFDTRYAELGFNEAARLDDGPMWPTAYALVGWDDEVERRVTDLVCRAVSTD